mmetsp:Transcript_3598/g.6580  ORF Transcript_3598/g.6580 Transcript_3598/m.6580 type:complete len:419 (-) Transcript_3598:157-1413(-)
MQQQVEVVSCGKEYCTVFEMADEPAEKEGTMPKSWASSDEDYDASLSDSEEGIDLDRLSKQELLPLDPNETWEKIRACQVFQDPPRSTMSTKPSEGITRLVVISDTHGQHRKIHLPRGDILIHGGDFSKTGEVKTIEDLSAFFRDSGFEEVVAIAGNHDLTLDNGYYEKSWRRFHRKQFSCKQAQDAIRRHCVYLQDSEYTTKSGLRIYGSPYSPEFFNWAFNLERGAPIRKIWDQIPSKTDRPIDILITHGPPLGRGDLTVENVRAGCYDLLKATQERVKPRVCIFGHIHEGYGVSSDGEVLYVNASSLDVKYRPINRPIVIDIPHHDMDLPASIVSPKNSIVTCKEEFYVWCKQKGYEIIAEALASYDGDDLPAGDALLQQEAFMKLVDILHLHRLTSSRFELEEVLASLYAASFE